MMTRSERVSKSQTQKERKANRSGVVLGCEIRRLKEKNVVKLI
jgi:2-keto-3-deoxy-galactonokinase